MIVRVICVLCAISLNHTQSSTFKINVVSVGGTISSAERGKLIETCFDYIDFKGKVQMDQTRKGVRAGKGPRADNQFWWLEDVGNPPHVSSSTGLVPHRRWFAREVALSQRPLLERYDLKKRLAARHAEMCERDVNVVSQHPATPSWFKLFRHVDADGSGFVDVPEFQIMLRELGACRRKLEVGAELGAELGATSGNAKSRRPLCAASATPEAINLRAACGPLSLSSAV